MLATVFMYSTLNYYNEPVLELKYRLQTIDNLFLIYFTIKWSLVAERGVEYEFRVSAANAVDFGETAVAVIRTPDGGTST